MSVRQEKENNENKCEKKCLIKNNIVILFRGRRVRDRIVVGFITTYAISANHH
jgi:hypothetical protein